MIDEVVDAKAENTGIGAEQIILANFSRCYNGWQFKELEEHKYYKCEKERRPLEFDCIMTDWITIPVIQNPTQKTHAERYSDAFQSNQDSILQSIAQRKCYLSCKGPEHCVFSKEEVHRLLKD